MKGSAVVQGLKSLASKLHPQLPLSPKESSRLLTALTSSFRQQLDAAHPRPVSDEKDRPKLEDGATPKTGNHGLHSSSAALADKHLASVLTNPLLTRRDGAKKPTLDYTTAKIDLQKNPAKDPISLLEDFSDKGAATIPIAVLCLETFQKLLDNLDADKRRNQIVQTEAGKRTLLWLWKSKLYETDAFVDDKRLVEVMVPIVIEEGFENYLWEWLKLDMQLGSQSNDKTSSAYANTRRAYRFRWKGYLLRAIVAAKLKQDNAGSINEALDAFFRGCDLKQECSANGPQHTYLPLRPAGMILESALWKAQRPFRNLDPDRYDRFLLATTHYTSVRLFRDLHASFSHLCHPCTPTPLPLLKLMKRIFSGDPTTNPFDIKVRERFESPRSEQHARVFYKMMLNAAAQLQDAAYTQDADWVFSQIHRLYRQHTPFIAMDLRELRKATVTADAREEKIERPPEPVPFPTFV